MKMFDRRLNYPSDNVGALAALPTAALLLAFWASVVALGYWVAHKNDAEHDAAHACRWEPDASYVACKERHMDRAAID